MDENVLALDYEPIEIPSKERQFRCITSQIAVLGFNDQMPLYIFGISCGGLNDTTRYYNSCQGQRRIQAWVCRIKLSVSS